MRIDFDTTPLSSNGIHPRNDGAVRADASASGAHAEPATPAHHRVEIGGFNRPAVATLMVLLVAAGIGDFVNAKTVFDLTFPTSASYLAWTLAISITTLAVVATHAAGYLFKEAGSRRSLKALGSGVMAGWLGAGVLLGVLRVAVASVASSSGASSSSNPFAGINTGASEPHALGVAAVLGAVWVMTGLVSFAIGYLAHAPAGTALERIERQSAKIGKAVGDALRHERLAAHTLAAQQGHLARLTTDGQRLAKQAANAHRDQLLAWARIEIARVLGDPAATNDVLPRPVTQPTTSDKE